MISRRVPTRAPVSPWDQPGITWERPNSAGVPRFQDESKIAPSDQETPTYCTVTVEFGLAAGPEPETKSIVIKSVGGFPVGLAMVGSAPGAPLTAGKAFGSDGLGAVEALVSAGGDAGVVAEMASGCEVHPVTVKSRSVAADVASMRGTGLRI